MDLAKLLQIGIPVAIGVVSYLLTQSVVELQPGLLLVLGAFNVGLGILAVRLNLNPATPAQ